MADVYVVADLCSNLEPFTEIHIAYCIEAATKAGANAVKIQFWGLDEFPTWEQREKERFLFPEEALAYVERAALQNGIPWGATVSNMRAAEKVLEAGASFLKTATRNAHSESVGELLQTLPFWQRLIPYLVVLRSFDARKFRPTGTIVPYIPMVCLPIYPQTEIPQWPAGEWPWGYSSHTCHALDVLKAVQFGATVIEKHIRFTDRDPETPWSLSCDEFGRMVHDIKSA